MEQEYKVVMEQFRGGVPSPEPTGNVPKITFQNFCGHLKTILKHKHLVRVHCFKMGLYKQGILHDMSKFSPVEFWTGVRYFQGTRSPNAAERDAKGYSEAWLHHKGRNKHHFEYWVDFSGRNFGTPFGVKPGKMPDRYIAEMIADRVAACKTYHGKDYKQGDALSYHRLAKEPLPMHPYTLEMLEKFLNMLAEEGEEKTFSYIRHEFLHK